MKSGTVVKRVRVLIAAGGTGGHIYPGIAVAQQLAKDNIDLLFVGRAKGIETDIIKRYKFTYKGIDIEPFHRKVSMSILKIFVKLLIALYQSISILGSFKPDVIIGTGGYVCFPVVLGGWFLGIPAIIHEQNIVPGLTNRLLGKIVDKVTVSFVDSGIYFNKKKVKVTGNPVREEILSVDKTSANENLGLLKDKITILILGGSLGAHSINLAILEALDYLVSIKDKIQIIHITGKDDYEMVNTAYKEKGYNVKSFSFIHNIENPYGASDLVICRAGATTLAELTTLGLPCILIPYPFAVGNHQKKNADVLANNGAATIILNEELTGKKLANEILRLVNNPSELNTMAINSKKIGKPDAAVEIAKLIYSLAK